MAYRAFLLGRNGGNLGWCYRSGDLADPDGLDDCNVRRMRDALRGVGYQTVVAPETLSLGQLVDRLADVLRSADQDTVLFYFSGHGHLDEHGFNLVLREAGEGHPDPEYWSTDEVIGVLKRCKANSKLLILDCCYAGAAAFDSWQRMQGNIAILASANENSLSSMRPGTGGRFTQCLCDALTSGEYWVTGPTGVTDERGIIWFQRLCGWIKWRMGSLESGATRTPAAEGQCCFAEPVCYVGMGALRIRVAEVSLRHRREDRQMSLEDLEALGKPVFYDQVEGEKPRDFFGRQREKKQVLRHLTGDDPQVVIVQGERRMGKTSMLLLIERELRRRDPAGERTIVTPYAIVDTVKSASEFFWALTKGLPPVPVSVDEVVEGPSYDVFLSYRHGDGQIAAELAEKLKARDLEPAWDREHLTPGVPWQAALEGIIQSTPAAAIPIGEHGIANWQEREMRSCISRAVVQKMRVIPVLLPGAPEKVELPSFLDQGTRVDLRGGLTDQGLDALYWGVTGRKPGESDTSAPPLPRRGTPRAPSTGLATLNPDEPFKLDRARNWLTSYLKRLPGKRIFVFMDELDECLVSHAPAPERELIMKLIRLLATDFREQVRLLFSMIRIPARLDDRETETFVTEWSRVIYLEPFALDADYAAMVRLLEPELSVTDQNIARLHQWSGGWPFFSKVVMWEIERLSGTANPWDKAFIEAVSNSKRKLTEAMEHIVRHHLDSDEQEVFRLLAVASLPVTIGELKSRSAKLPGAAERLESRCYLLCNDDAYAFRVELLRDWFRRRAPGSGGLAGQPSDSNPNPQWGREQSDEHVAAPRSPSRQAGAEPLPEGKRPSRPRFRVALSFSSDHRKLVRDLAKTLTQRGAALQDFQVLFDERYQSELAGSDRDSRLEKLYRHESELMVVLLRKRPNETDWCGLGWSVVKDIIRDRHARRAGVMLCRFSEDVTLGDDWSGGYELIRDIPAKDLARRIIKRYRKLPGS